MARSFLNRCMWVPTSGGTGTWTVSTAAVVGNIPGVTPANAAAPAVVDGGEYGYFAFSGSPSFAYERGYGTYTSAGATLTRNVEESTNANALVDFSAAPTVIMGSALAHQGGTTGEFEVTGTATIKELRGAIDLRFFGTSADVNAAVQAAITAGFYTHILPAGWTYNPPSWGSDPVNYDYIPEGLTIIGEDLSTSIVASQNTITKFLLAAKNVALINCSIQSRWSYENVPPTSTDLAIPVWRYANQRDADDIVTVYPTIGGVLTHGPLTVGATTFNDTNVLVARNSGTGGSFYSQTVDGATGVNLDVATAASSGTGDYGIAIRNGILNPSQVHIGLKLFEYGTASGGRGIYLERQDGSTTPLLATIDTGPTAVTSDQVSLVSTFQTGGAFINLYQQTSAYAGNALAMNLGDGTGSFTGNFISLAKAGTTVFSLDSSGNLGLFTGSALNWNSGDVTITHSSNLLTFAGGNLHFGSAYVDMTEQTAPANPAANDGRLYVADNGGTTTLYFRDNAGTATNLLATATPGGSSGQLQYNNASAFGGMSGTSWDDTNRALTITGATVTTSNPIFDLTQTWNAAVTFTALKLNITDTSSNSASLLADLQVGGASQFAIDKSGNTFLAGGAKIDFNAGDVTLTHATGTLTSTGAIVASNGTLTASQAAFYGTQTWNNVAVAFNAFIINPTDTTSASGSTLLKLQVGSSDKFVVDKSGNFKSTGVAVSSLLAAATAGTGARAFVTDASSPTFGSAVTGGGAVAVPVYSDGSSWIVG